MTPYWTDGDRELYVGDCRAALAGWADAQVDALVSDVPYELGFMGKSWDATGISFDPAFWREVRRVLRPGAPLLVFGGTRTWHRIAVALEDAGLELRDTLMWMHGQGFPKSKNYAEDISRATRETAEHDVRFMRRTDLSPTVYACYQCWQVLQPRLSKSRMDQVQSTQTDEFLSSRSIQSSMEGRGNLQASTGQLSRCSVCTMSHGILVDGAERRLYSRAQTRDGTDDQSTASILGSSASYKPRSEQQLPNEPDAVFLERRAQAFRGYGTALKPAWEPILLAMAPLDGTFAANALTHGVAGLHVDAGRIGTERRFSAAANDGLSAASLAPTNVTGYAGREVVGRWPANVLLDEAAAARLDAQSGDRVSRRATVDTGGKANFGDEVGGADRRGPRLAGYDDAGGASRFFYVAKPTDADRGYYNAHPTVKPSRLMEYLLRLVETPTGGLVLGSGTTLVAARRLGRQAVGIEQNRAYADVAVRRLEETAVGKPLTEENS